MAKQHSVFGGIVVNYKNRMQMSSNLVQRCRGAEMCSVVGLLVVFFL